MAEEHVARALEHRDSHDLSLSPRNVTRDSLVTNMLLSLDQFASKQKPPRRPTYDDDDDSPQFFDIPRSRATNHSGAGTSHQQQQHHQQSHQQHHQYSYSSDFEGDEDMGAMSNSFSRGRRSNSSTAYQQDTLNRLNGGRDSMSRSHPPPSSRGPGHTRGGFGSMSSSATSFDGGGNGSHRERTFARSASFDTGPTQGNSNKQQHHLHLHQHQHQQHPQTLDHVPQSPFSSGFANSFLTDDFDSAPEPTVPGGPRRTPSMPVMPPPPREPTGAGNSGIDSSHHHHHDRRRSPTRSVKSSSGGRGKSSYSKSQSQSQAQARESMFSASADPDSAPAPSVGYGKSKEPGPSRSGQASPAIVPTPVKEKPTGFFRKFFGGGSSKQTTANAVRPVSPAIASTIPVAVEAATTTITTGSARMASGENTPRNVSAPPSRDTTSAHSNHPTLQKKPSSFFRRKRQKSVIDESQPVPAEADAPPMPDVAPLKIQAEKDRLVPQPQLSPASSLRQVMDQYLHDGGNTPRTPAGKVTPMLSDITNTVDRTDTHTEYYKKDFSPDYEPSPSARIRTVRSNIGKDPEVVDTPSRRPPARANRSPETANGSFLDLDGGSDNDDDEAVPTPEITVNSKAPPKDSSNQDTLRAKKKPSRPNLTVETGRSSRPASKAGVRIDPGDSGPKSSAKSSKTMTKSKPLDEPEFVVGDPTEDDRQKAQKIYDGNEDFIQKEKAASYIGEEGPVRQRTLRAYMDLYDFASQSVVYSLRQVCSRLVFRAETQQVDRILVAFSKRWCECNSNHGFKTSDVIHTICYSIMLLNTDLHMADIEQKMTRSQFVKNTMGTITQAIEESAPDAFDRRPSILPERSSMLHNEEIPTPSPAEPDRKSFRHSFRPSARTDGVAGGSFGDPEDCGPLVKAPFQGSLKQWQEQVEIVLKAIYASIRDEKLPLFGAESGTKSLATTPSQGSLSVMGMLKRTPSVLSKAPSESQLSVRGRADTSRPPNSRWNSKSRSRPGIGRTGFSSSRTSFDDGNSIWSPAMSSATWSRQSLGRTQTSLSQDSFASGMPKGDYQQSIGFANALSQAIIRDEDYGDELTPSIVDVDMQTNQLLEDESLELTGPPWVKEGMVIHKHHLDGVEKKSKDRNWSEVFAVIQKGQLSLFSFTANKSTRGKSRTRNAGPVGGGNWQDNATNLGTFPLGQTLASSLPPPGYSRTRPHVWALSLPTGAVHLFQVGTAEIIKEFVTTANYWSARLSTHPLIGGISNIEYGWSDNIVNNALVGAMNEPESRNESRPSSRATHGRKSSITGSLRSASIDQATSAFTNMSGRGKLPGDRIHITEWTPPSQSLRPSHASESQQLEVLSAYVKSVEDDLQTHNQLRSPMLLAFTPRGYNAQKAMANWERKSAYLLREIVKFRTYVDCLQQAESRKQQIYAERELAQKAARGELSDGDMDVSGDEGEGDETLRP